MKRILKCKNGFGNDGQQHYTRSRDIAAWVLLLACASVNLRIGFVVSVLFVVAYALARIWQNRGNNGTYSLIDLLATLAGGVSVWIWVLLFKILLS